MTLDWPEGFPRTDPADRERYPGGFRVSRRVAFQNVLNELKTWDVTDVQLDSGMKHLKRDPNKPYADASFDDPGVVVRFTKDGEQMAAACDRWDNPRDNAKDLAKYLNETRMQEQRGTVTAQSEYEKLRLPSGDDTTLVDGRQPHAVLGVSRNASEAEIRRAFREKIKQAHPDTGDGNGERVQTLKEAKDALLDRGDS